MNKKEYNKMNKNLKGWFEKSEVKTCESGLYFQCKDIFLCSRDFEFISDLGLDIINVYRNHDGNGLIFCLDFKEC